FLVGHQPAVAVLLRTLERRGDQVVEGPDALQVRIAPRGFGRRVVRILRSGRAKQHAKADPNQCQNPFDHLKTDHIMIISWFRPQHKEVYENRAWPAAGPL